MGVKGWKITKKKHWGQGGRWLNQLDRILTEAGGGHQIPKVDDEEFDEILRGIRYWVGNSC